MKGFKDFILRGNLVELAVAFVIAAAFATVVTAAVDVIMDLVGKAGGIPDFSDYEPGGVSFGAFLTALVAFLILSVIVYFFIVTPYAKARERVDRDKSEAPAVVTEDVALLTEIRVLLAVRDNQP